MPALSKGFSQGLALAIPLAVKKFEIEAAQKKWETEMDIKQDELNLANEELEEEKREARVKILTESFKEQAAAGSQEGMADMDKKLQALGMPGKPQVPGMSPEVLDIAQQLRGEGGVPLEEGIPRKFYTPPTEQEKFEAKEKLKQEHKINLEKLRQKGKVPDNFEVEEALKQKHRIDLEELRQSGKRKKPGVSYLLKDRSRVTSFDGGRTYRNEAGKDVKMPFDAVKISTTLTGADLAMYDAQAKAKTELGKGGEAAQAGDMAEIAEGGTGPFAMAAAAVDSVLGGLGVDKLFGAKGIFSNTQENRQVLRTIRQLGKAALMNSPRFPVHEQKLMDKLFPDPDKAITNPRTEAKKFVTLRKILAQEKEFNLLAITEGVTKEEVSALRKSNMQIDRLLALIGTDERSGGGPQVGVVEEGYKFKGGDPADPKSWEKVKVK